MLGSCFKLQSFAPPPHRELSLSLRTYICEFGGISWVHKLCVWGNQLTPPAALLGFTVVLIEPKFTNSLASVARACNHPNLARNHPPSEDVRVVDLKS